MTHTPTPWKLEGLEIRTVEGCEGHGGSYIRSGKTLFTLTPDAFTQTGVEVEANLSYIASMIDNYEALKAQHDELVEALKKISLGQPDRLDHAEDCARIIRAANIAQKALKNAGAL